MNVDIHGAPIYFEIPILGGIKITYLLAFVISLSFPG